MGEKELGTTISLAEMTKIKQMISNLESTIQLNNNLIDSLPDLFILVDTDAKILLLNKSMANSIGETKENLIGKNILDYFPPHVSAYREKMANKVISTKKPIIFEDERDKRWFRTRCFPVFNAEGKVIQIVATIEEITEQKKLEIKKLKNKDAYYSSLVENSSDLISITEANGNIKYESPALKKLFGYHLSERIGRNIFEYLHPDDIPRIKTFYTDVVKKSGRTLKAEYRIRHKNGSWRYVESTGNNQLRNPNIKGVIINTRDITEKKQAEEKIREREEQFRMLSEQSLMGIVIVQGNEIKYVNDAAVSEVGYTREEVCKGGVSLLMEIIHPEDKPFAMDQLKRKLRGEKNVVAQYPLRIYTKNGKLKWVEIYSKTIEYNNGTADLITLVDITDRMLAENSLRESEEKWRSLVENAPESERILIVDQKGKILFANRINTARKFDNFGGGNVFDFIPPKSRPIVKKALDAVFTSGKPQKYETIIMKSDGTEAIFDTSAAPIKGERGVKAAIIIAMDITDLRNAEEEAKKRKNHLQNVIDSASEIIFTIRSDYKIATWNNTAEKITGYKKNHVVGRSIKQLQLFEHPNEIIDYIQAILKGKTTAIERLVINTAYGTRRLLSVSPSFVQDEAKKITEFLFVCKDSTHEKEAHGRILFGRSYLISEETNNTAIEVFSGLIHSKHPGLYIGRTTKEQFQSMYPDITAQVIKLTTHTDERHRTSTDLKELYHEIENFITKNKQSVILLDRLDYLITMFSFETVVKTLYKINDQIEKHRSLLLLRLNPSLLDRKEMAVLQEEFHQLPAQQIEDVQLTESLFRILQYIHDENNRNMMVTYSKIGKKFSISKVTVQKRIEALKSKGLVYSKKRGRFKILYIAEKGKTLLNRRPAL